MSDDEDLTVGLGEADAADLTRRVMRAAFDRDLVEGHSLIGVAPRAALHTTAWSLARMAAELARQLGAEPEDLLEALDTATDRAIERDVERGLRDIADNGGPDSGG